jgi:hypothetical protein
MFGRVLVAVAAARLLRAPEQPACALPADLANHTAQGWSLVQGLATDEVVVLGQGEEDAGTLNLLVYDCAKNQQLLFMHIPKNAGSTIEDIANAQGVKWGRNSQLSARMKMTDGNECNKWHVPPALLPAPNPYQNAEVFCVTRHPYDRILSEYRYLLNVPWGKENPRLRAAPDCTPEGLNTFAARTMHMVLGGQAFLSDCHFVPQASFVWGPQGKQWCQNILRIDTLPTSFNNLMHAKGLGVTLGAEKKNSKADTCPGLTTAAFTKETKRVMNQVYAQDFERLGYNKGF